MSAVMAERQSATVINDWIRVWRHARLSKGSALGWPSISILGRIQEMGPFAAVGGGRYGSRLLGGIEWSQWDRDAIRVQEVVNRMPEEMRAAFEAYHLAIIRGDRCRDQPHKARANILGIPATTYFRRVDAGWHYVAEMLSSD